MKLNKPSKSPALGAATASLAVALIVAGSASAAVDIFVDLRTGPGPADRILGESDDPDHPEWIEVRALAAGANNQGTSASRRRVPKLFDFVLVREVDKATPKLQEALFTGEVFPEMVVKYPLDGMHPGMLVILHEVGVSSYRTSMDGASEARPTEEVAFYYNKIEWIYRPSPLLGEPEGAFGFDLLFGTDEPGRDDDGDGIENILDPDDDNDGVDDEYELAHGLHPLFADSHFDDDGDGKLNYDEWLAGTASDDGRSRFGIHSISLDRTGNVTIKIPTIGDRRYRLRSSFALAEGGWTVLDEFRTEPGSPPEMVELELPAGAAAQFDRLFFSVEVATREAGEPRPIPGPEIPGIPGGPQ